MECVSSFGIQSKINSASSWRHRVQKMSSTSTEVDDAYTPYQGDQPKEALSEIFIPQVLPNDIEEELLWVPQTESVSFR